LLLLCGVLCFVFCNFVSLFATFCFLTYFLREMWQKNTTFVMLFTLVD